jgi:hypothetical protein
MHYYIIRFLAVLGNGTTTSGITGLKSGLLPVEENRVLETIRRDLTRKYSNTEVLDVRLLVIDKVSAADYDRSKAQFIKALES